MKKIFVVLGVLLVSVGCSGAKKTVKQAYQPDLAKGASIYRTQCSQCHDTGDYGAPELKMAEDWDLQTLGRPGIVKQHRAMNVVFPASSRLSDEDEADALYYIRHELGEKNKDY